MMVQYESSVMSQQAMVQNGNKGSDEKGKEKREKEEKEVVHSYGEVMTILV